MSQARDKILVVDDQEASRYSLVRALRGAAYDVLEAGTGKRGLELAREAAVDLVLLDVCLPDIDGFEVAERLKADPVTRPIAILQTSASFTSADARARGLRRGADAYLTHPTEPEVLVATVQALLRLRHAERRAHELAADRERLVSELREEARRKNEFLAVLSHELRNPLTPIKNSVHILGRVAPDGPQAVRAREVIERQVQHMTRLIEDLLDVTRISRGKVRLQRETVELGQLLRRVADDHKEQFVRGNIDFAVELGDEPILVDGDPTRIAQVVGNILQNAAKFTPPDGHVKLSLHRERASAAVIRILDDGAGIARETLLRVFEPFVQSDRTLDRSQGGLGLGLALAKGLIELHGGSIAVWSEGHGRGAEVTIVLPTLAAPRGGCP